MRRRHHQLVLPPQARFGRDLVQLATELLERSLKRAPHVRGGKGGERRLRDGVVERQLPAVDAACQVSQARQPRGLLLRERPARVVAVAGHDHAICQFRERGGRGRPVERVAVPEPGNGAVLDEIAGEEDAGARDA